MSSVASQEIEFQIEQQQIQTQLSENQQDQKDSDQNVQEGAAVVSSLNAVMQQIKTQMSEPTDSTKTESVSAPASSSSNTPASGSSGIPNSLLQDLEQIDAANNQENLIQQKLMALLSEAGANAFMLVPAIMSGALDAQGASTGSIAGSLNLDSDLQAEFGQVQGDLNQIMNGGDSPSDVTTTQNMINTVNSLQNFINQMKAEGSNSPIDSSVLSTLQSTLDSFKSSFNGGDDWGNAGQMMNDMQTPSNGQFNQDQQNAINACQEGNQTTAALGSTAQEQLQMSANNYQTMESSLSQSFQGLEQAMQAIVNNQRSS